MSEFHEDKTKLNNDLQALDDVYAELQRARSLFGPMHSAHEGYAVILEEMDELKEHVWMKQSKRNMDAMYKEACQ